MILALFGVILVERSLYGFRKIPFACSYLPGKANLKVKLSLYGGLFLLLCPLGIQIEAVSLESAESITMLALILLAIAAWSWFRTVRMSASPNQRVQFEEVPVADIYALDLTAEGAEAPKTTLTTAMPRGTSVTRHRPRTILQ